MQGLKLSDDIFSYYYSFTCFCGILSHIKSFVRYLYFLYKQTDFRVVSNYVTCLCNGTYCCFQHSLAFVTFVTVYRLERDAYPLFRTLRQKYKTSTDRDPVFQEVVLFLEYFVAH
jgi:hypothetical protein